MRESAGIPTLTIRTRDFNRSVSFYRALLGDAVFETDVCREPSKDPRPMAFFGRGAGYRLIIKSVGNRLGAPRRLRGLISSGHPGRTEAALRRAGHEVLVATHETAGGKRLFVARDPDGNEIAVGGESRFRAARAA